MKNKTYVNYFYLKHESSGILKKLFHPFLFLFIGFANFRLISVKTGSIDPRVDIPEIEVSFANGVKQKMVLRHYNAIPNSESVVHSRLCNYLGHLEGDEIDSTVAVTGCLMGDNPDKKVHITLLSRHSPSHKTFSMDRNGNVKHIEVRSDDDFKNEMEEKMILPEEGISTRDTKWKVCGKDSYVNEEIEAAAAEVTPAQRNAVPKHLTVKLRLGVDIGVKRYLERRGKTVDNWLSEVMTHAQSHYTHSSLQHKIIFEVIKCFLVLGQISR